MARNHFSERTTLDVLHCDERTIILFADLVNGADMRMIQGGCCLRLPQDCGTRIERTDGECLDGDWPLKDRIECSIDDTHPACGDAPTDLKRTETRPWRQRQS